MAEDKAFTVIDKRGKSEVLLSIEAGSTLLAHYPDGRVIELIFLFPSERPQEPPPPTTWLDKDPSA